MGTTAEPGDLRYALMRAVQAEQAHMVRVHLTGDPAQWDVDGEAWRLWPDLLRMRGENRAVELCILRDAIGRMERAVASRLAGAAESVGVSLRVLAEPARAGAGYVLAEMAAPGRSCRWATLSPDVGVPGPRWGSSTHLSVIVRGDQRSALQDMGKTLEVDELRPKRQAGAMVVQVLRQLDGPISDFGSRFWNLLLKHSQQLIPLLRDAGSSLVRLRYVDRYLRSPVAVRLLHETVRRLTEIAGARISTPVPMEVRISYLGKEMRPSPSTFENDWESEDMRRTMLENVLRPVGLDVKVIRASTGQMPHARTLEADWSDGRRLTIALDQGFGVWRDLKGTPFPFSQGEQSQLQRLLTANFEVGTRSSFAVPIYVHPLAVPKVGG